METEVGGEEEEDGNKDFDAAMRRQMMKRRTAFEQRAATSRRGGADGDVLQNYCSTISPCDLNSSNRKATKGTRKRRH